MAFTGSNKLTTAENEERNAASAVKNYGNFTPLSDTNKYKQNMNSAYSNVLNFEDFTPSASLVSQEEKKTNAENAVANYGSFGYDLQSTYDDLMNKRLNREEFSYDVTGDALYQQYKDQYVNQGKMAMMDTMGQASAMTGGYGNSYAQMAGQQAYQGYLQQLNDKVPELYKLALDKYTVEGNEMDKQYAMLADDRAVKYGEWSDGYNRAVADRDYYANDYNNAYSREYGEYTDKYNRAVDAYDISSDAYNNSWDQDRTVWRDGLDQLIDQRDYAANYAANLYDQEYGAYRDNVSDQQWQDEFDEMVRMNSAEITTEEQQTAADNCYAAIKSGVMPSDEMIKEAGLDKDTVTKMVNERKTAIDLANQQTQASIDASKIDLSGYIPVDDIEVDPVTGDITGVDGYTLAGDNTVARAKPNATISGFKAKAGNNFKVSVNGTTYKVENDGEVTDVKVIEALNKATTTSDTQIVAYNDEMYVKSGGAYYKIGSRNIIGEWGTANDDLYNLAMSLN